MVEKYGGVIMKVTLEQIDSLRERANVSYQDAKEALEKFEGDIVDALVYLEKEKKVKASKKAEGKSDFWERIKGIIRKGNKAKLQIRNESRIVLNIPLNLAIVITIFATHIAILGLVLTLLTKHNIRIEKSNGEDFEVNKVFDKMASAVNTMKTESRQEKPNLEKKTEE